VCEFLLQGDVSRLQLESGFEVGDRSPGVAAGEFKACQCNVGLGVGGIEANRGL
jgi:hypothetical protein